MSEKKKWETPRLICLYRGRPEEAVLQVCKMGSEKGPSTTQGNCANPKASCWQNQVT